MDDQPGAADLAYGGEEAHHQFGIAGVAAERIAERIADDELDMLLVEHAGQGAALLDQRDGARPVEVHHIGAEPVEPVLVLLLIPFPIEVGHGHRLLAAKPGHLIAQHQRPSQGVRQVALAALAVPEEERGDVQRTQGRDSEAPVRVPRLRFQQDQRVALPEPKHRHLAEVLHHLRPG